MSICTSETQGKETALRFGGARDLNVFQKKNVAAHFFFFEKAKQLTQQKVGSV